jgi:TRAP-type C4-dicarboxylate transport system substrate-binding protein
MPPANQKQWREEIMKRKYLVLLSLILFIGFSFNISPAQAQIKLTFNNYLPPIHVASQLSEAYCKEIEKRTHGEVKITHYAGGQLLKGPEVFQGVVNDIADIGFTNLAYTRGRFPEMEMCDLPLGMPSGWVATYVVNKFYEKFKPKGFEKVKVLFFVGSGPNLISTTSWPIRTLEDLKGQTLRATGRVAEVAAALGATSRPMVIGETYEALKRHVISGVMLPLETMKTFRLGELLKYSTTDWQVGNIYTFYAVMNKSKWDSLPANIKKVFEEVNKEYIDKEAMGWNEIDLTGAKFFKSKGGKFITLSDTEAAKWNLAVRPVIDAYINETSKLGVSAAELEKRIEFIRKTRDEMTKVQLSKKIPMPYAE